MPERSPQAAQAPLAPFCPKCDGADVYSHGPRCENYGPRSFDGTLIWTMTEVADVHR